MSSANVANNLYRQWLLLQLLPSVGEGISNAELQQKLQHEGISVSLRTIQRDMESICQRFPIYSTCETKPLRWRWVEDRKIDIQGMSLNDALSLMLIESSMKHLLPASALQCLYGKFEHAKQVLQANRAQSEIASWFDKVGSVNPGIYQQPPKIDDLALANIQQALLKDQSVEIQYKMAHQATSKAYQLTPLALVQRGIVLYLVAKVIGEQQTKLFAMQRVISAIPSDLPNRRPADFNLQSYLDSGAMEFSNGQLIQLEAKVANQLAVHLRETPLSDDMTLEPLDEDYVALKATVHEGWQLHWWLMSTADQLEVISPPELRLAIKQKLQSALAQYQQ